MIEISRDICGYCGTCAGVCPQNAITLQDLFVEIEHEKCIRCGLCVRACPLGALKLRAKSSDCL